MKSVKPLKQTLTNDDVYDITSRRVVTPVVKVKRWLSADNKVLLVFLGSRSPPYLSLLKRLEKGESQKTSLTPSQDGDLKKAYGEEYQVTLAFADLGTSSTKVKYVPDALFIDDTVKAVKHKITEKLVSETSASYNELNYNDIYLWTTKKTVPSSALSRAFVKESFKNRLTAHVQDVSRDLSRYKIGHYDGPKHDIRSDSKHISAAHATKLIDSEGGINQITRPVGYNLVTNSAGHTVFFDHHPYKARELDAEGGGSSFSVVYHENDLISEYLDFGSVTTRSSRETHVCATNLTINVTTKLDFQRHLQRNRKRDPREESIMIEKYFPKSFRNDTSSRDVSNPFVRDLVLREHDTLLDWGHSTPLRSAAGDASSDVGLLLVQLRNYNNIAMSLTSASFADSSSAVTSGEAFRDDTSRRAASSADAINLEAVFNLFPTSSRVPLVKYYDGSESLYKVNRMALHKGNIDATWVTNWFSKRGKSKSSQPFVQFIARVDMTYDDTDDYSGTKKPATIYTRCLLFSNGRMDLSCGFSVNAPGQVKNVVECMRAVNLNVVQVLNRVDKDGLVTFQEFDENVLHPTTSAFYTGNHSFTEIVNVITNVTVDLTEELHQQQQRRSQKGGKDKDAKKTPPSLEKIAHVMNDLFPYFDLVIKQAPIMGSGLSAFYKRTDQTGNDMSWIVAIRTLKTVFGMDKERMVKELAHMFLVPEDIAEQRVSDAQKGVYAEQQRVLLLQHYVPHVPTVTVKPQGRAGFRISTVLMTDMFLVRRVVDLMRRVVQFAASAAADKQHANSEFRLHAAKDENSSLDIRPAAKNNSTNTSSSRQNASEVSATDLYSYDFDFDSQNPPVGQSSVDAGDDGVDPLTLIDDQIEDILSEDAIIPNQHEALPPPQSVNNGAASSGYEDDDMNDRFSDGAGNILEELKRADPDVFDNKAPSGSKHRYATRCGAASKRQPVVVSKEELEHMNPESYGNTAIAYGSTPEKADQNRYICPKVWCPESRVGMTLEQYKASGEKCPKADEGEEAIVFDNSYWKGKPRYPGLIGSTKHPTGLCMPCCYLHYKPSMQTCDSSGPSSASTNNTSRQNDATSSSSSSSQKDDENDDSHDFKYIKGDTLPLENKRFGMIPSALLSAFHGDATKSNKFSCGSRDDGSGQFTFKTDCYVRRGIPSRRQSFLQCMAELLEVDGGVEALVDIISNNITPNVYVAMNDGLVCRMFMDQAMTAVQDSPSGDMAEGDSNRFESFVKWFLENREYQERMGLEWMVSLLRSATSSSKSREVRHHPEVRREYLIYKSLQRFKAYLQDDGIIKVHKLLLGLFNMRLPWLNPRGVNFIVFEQSLEDTSRGQSNSDMFVDCEGLRQDADRMRLSHPFAFITKQGGYYEPINRVRFNRYRQRPSMDIDSMRDAFSDTRPGSSSKASASSSSEKRKKLSSNIINEVFFLYDKNKNIRALVDAILTNCRASSSSSSSSDASMHTQTGRLCTSGACMSRFLQRVMGRRLKAQVVDYTFRLRGLVTVNDIYVPLMNRETMLVGERAPPRVMYLADIIKLRPSIHVAPPQEGKNQKRRDLDSSMADALEEMFGRLAELTGDDRYLVSTRLPDNSALELKSGNVVPISITEPKGELATYLENLNIMVGKKVADDRVKYIESVRHDAKVAAQDSAIIAHKLEENTDLLRQFVFLRSAFNPFPLWYRRHRMRGLLEAMGMRRYQQQQSPKGNENEKSLITNDLKESHLIDSLIFGPDVFHRRNNVHAEAINRKMRNLRSSASTRPDLIISDLDILTGNWLKRVQNVVINPFAVDTAKDSAAHKAAAAHLHLHLHGQPPGSHPSGVKAPSVNQYRDALLKTSASQSACRAASTKSASSLYRSRSTTASTSSVSARRRAYRLINACGVWQVFQAVALLVLPGAKGVPMGAFKYIIADFLVSDVRKYLLATDAPQDKAFRVSVDAILTDHPSFGKHWRASPLHAHGKSTSTTSSSSRHPATKQQRPRLVQHDVAAEVPVIRAMISEMDSPLYSSGLYDVMALCTFCDVACDVIMIDDNGSRLHAIGYGVYASDPKRPPIVEVPGLPLAHATFNGNSGTARNAVVLVHKHPSSFDLVSNHESLLFPYRRYEAHALKKQRHPRRSHAGADVPRKAST